MASYIMHEKNDAHFDDGHKKSRRARRPVFIAALIDVANLLNNDVFSNNANKRMLNGSSQMNYELQCSVALY